MPAETKILFRWRVEYDWMFRLGGELHQFPTGGRLRSEHASYGIWAQRLCLKTSEQTLSPWLFVRLSRFVFVGAGRSSAFDSNIPCTGMALVFRG